MSSSGRRHGVNLLQVESIEERHADAKITFTSGTTLVVDETLDVVIRMLSRRHGPVGGRNPA